MISQIWTPHSHSLVTAQPMLMKLEIITRRPTHRAKWYFNCTTWVVGVNNMFSTFLSLSFLIPSSWAQVALVDWFLWSIRYMTSFHARMCLYGFCSCTFPLRGSYPPKTVIFGTWIGRLSWKKCHETDVVVVVVVVNRHFQAKSAKYSKFHIIETTAWIATNFCTPVKTTRYSTWVVQKCSKHIQDGGRPPSWKIEKSW